MDFALTSDHDLETSTLDLRLVTEAEKVKQQVLIKLKLWKGEWFLDADFGTPYLQSILGKQLTLSGALTALRLSILEVDDIQAITEFTYDFDNQTRILSVDFTAQTPYGQIEVSA